MNAKLASPAPLPVDGVLPALVEALRQHPAVILQAPPGAGKSTRVPPALLHAGIAGSQKLLMLEPRRLAARNVALRMAHELGEELGDRVGYQIRFERRISPRTRIEVLTEGILTRRLQSDPELKGVGVLIFDEFHERHLHSDLSLALARDVQAVLRPELRILIMSATLDSAALSRLLDGAPVIESRGRTYPVTVRHRPTRPPHHIARETSQAILTALREEHGDLLAFLPGVGEILTTKTLLAERLDPHDADILPLYGELGPEAQQRALQPGAQRRVILATNIAETSLTIEGVRIVVDSGWARQPRFDPASGLTRLQTARISKASAEQRCGRAGRLEAGVCYRLWSEDLHRGLLAQTPPEIRAADLASLLLELKQWGVQDPCSLQWLDPPPAAALAQAEALLRELGALDEHGSLTAFGHRMSALPTHPRLAAMILRGQALDLAAPACDLAALLAERDIVKRRPELDLHDRLEALADWRARGGLAAEAWGLDETACRQADQSARQWRQIIAAPQPAEGVPEPEIIGLLTAFAYPDRIARQREPEGRRYLLANGRGAVLPGAGTHLPVFLVAAQLDAGQAEARIHLAQGIAPAHIQTHFSERIRLEERVAWDARERRVRAVRTEKLGALTLSEAGLDKPPREQVLQALLEGIRQEGPDALPWSPEARQWQARVAFLCRIVPGIDLPAADDDALLQSLEDWLAPHLGQAGSLQALARLSLHELLSERLDWRQRQQLESGAPSHLTVPSGSRIRLQYHAEQAPVLAVKLQELFGLAETPAVAWGKAPVMLHLLSPALRPIQVTQDLQGFWERTYPEVRKELKGRYPKHPWPDDPWTAQATRKTKRASTR